MSAPREHEHCGACGFDGAGYDDEALLDALRLLGATWQALLVDAGADLRSRPGPGVWSAIEYAAHTRDIVALHAYGVDQALFGDEPVYPAIDEGLVEAAAATYAEANPEVVAQELDGHAQQLARLAGDAGPAAWSRGLTVGEERSDVRRLLEHALHDALHHIDDVRRGLDILRNSG